MIIYFIAVRKEDKKALTERYSEKLRNIIRYLKSLTQSKWISVSEFQKFKNYTLKFIIRAFFLKTEPKANI